MIDEASQPTELAVEIAAAFDRKMAKGGEIDRILNGAQPIEKRPPASDQDIERVKRNVESLIADRDQAIKEAGAFISEWRGRQPRGFRARRRTPTPAAQPDEAVEF